MKNQTWQRRLVALVAATFVALTALIAPSLAPRAQAAPPSDLIINQLYARGGSTNAVYTNKFVELYNKGDVDIALSGISLQYFTAAATKASAVEALSGSIKAKSYFLIQLGSNGSNGGPLPAPDQIVNINPAGSNGAIALVKSTSALTLANPAAVTSNADVIDFLGYGTAVLSETTAAATVGGNSDPKSWQRTNFADTNDNSADFLMGAVLAHSSGGTTPPPVTVTDMTIAQIQGNQAQSPHVAKVVKTVGVVTAAYPTGGFDGYYLQSPGSGGNTTVSPTAPSDGIFVYLGAGGQYPAIGDCLEVTGTVAEFYGLTQLTKVSAKPQSNCAPPTPVVLTDYLDSDAKREALESMLVLPQGDYTITDNYSLNRYGSLALAFGTQPLRQSTDVVAPGQSAIDYEAANATKTIVLDDGSTWDYSKNKTAMNSALPYLSGNSTARVGAAVTFQTPVILDYRRTWNFQPTTQQVGTAQSPVTFTDTRPAQAPMVGGDLKVATFNVLNYFNDLGIDEAGCKSFDDRNGNPVTTNYCNVRGAYSPAAFADQQSKIVSAIKGLGVDVISLEEIENSTIAGKPRDAALSALVAAINQAEGSQVWSFVPSPSTVPNNGDAIRTAFIYRSAKVAPVGSSVILDDPAFTGTARSPLAQRFEPVVNADQVGTAFTIIVNHFKSKGSVLPGAANADKKDGQGANNAARVAQAQALIAFAKDLGNDSAVFLVGDFNAYSKEDPIRAIENSGFTNLAEASGAAPSYQFGGRMGSLDHVFGNAPASKIVTKVATWSINAEESIAFEYSRRNYNVVDFFQENAFRSSDHNPELFGLNVIATKPAPTPTNPIVTPTVPPVTASPAPGTGSPVLAATGADAGVVSVFALVLCLFGGALVVARRRHRSC